MSGPGPLSGHEPFMGPPLQMQVTVMPQQMRRDMSMELSRSLSSTHINNPAGLPPQFPQQAMPVQQHNISGQAYIELRHRPPDSRPRILLGPPPNMMDPSAQHQRHISYFSKPEFQGPRLMEQVRVQHPGLSNHVQVPPGLEHLIPTEQHSLMMHGVDETQTSEHYLHTSLSDDNMGKETTVLPLESSDASGLEEKLDPDDPSEKDLDVKDLDGVEVKDLDDEDLENINLDPDDAKGDDLDGLDTLETNDPQLDDLLRSGKFDIIAYTDPELDLGDKKDMFNEDLDLGVPIDDKLELQCKPEEEKSGEEIAKISSPGPALSETATTVDSEMKPVLQSPTSKALDVKSEEAVASTAPEQPKDVVSAPSTNSDQSEKSERENVPISEHPSDPVPLPAPDAASACGMPESVPMLTNLLTSESSELDKLDSPPGIITVSQPNSVPVISQSSITASNQVIEPPLNQSMGPRPNHDFTQESPSNSVFLPGQQSGHNFVPGDPLNQCPTGMQTAQQIMLQQSRERPLLLEEQPLLLQDLLDQERQEQQQQRQMQAMIRQRSEPFFPNIGM